MPIITHNGKSFNLTEDQIEAAYRYQLHQYRLSDAERQFKYFVYGSDPDHMDEEECQQAEESFLNEYGFPVSEGLSMLEDFVQRFEDDFDCNTDENSMWEQAIFRELVNAKKGGQQ